MATPAQQKKLEAFLKHPLKPAVLELLKQAIAGAELEPGEMGKSWGITLCPDAKTVVRLNCGNIALMDVTRGLIDPDDDDTYVRITVIDDELGILGPPRGMAVYEGFTNRVETSVFLVGSLDKWSGKIFNNKKICRAFKAHAFASKRSLPNPQWHNPLVEGLLLGSSSTQS